MSQGALQVSTTPPLPGATAVAAINTGLAALASLSSGTSAPTLGPGAASALVKGQEWLDTTTATANLRKMWDGAQWLAWLSIDTTNHSIKSFTAQQFIPTMNPVNGFAIDATACVTPSVANGGNLPLAVGGGLYLIADSNSSSQGLYHMNYGSGSLLNQNGGNVWVAPTTTPGAGKCSLAFNGTAYTIYNNEGMAQTFRVLPFRINPSA